MIANGKNMDFDNIYYLTTNDYYTLYYIDYYYNTVETIDSFKRIEDIFNAFSDNNSYYIGRACDFTSIAHISIWRKRHRKEDYRFSWKKQGF